MTELELRKKVVETIGVWLGGAKGSTQHYDILNTYNSDLPLPRGYAVKPNDPYCATTVSATWIRCGIAEYTGKECSCSELITIAKKLGFWVENDSHTPKIGDACVYDWDDAANYATTDNTGAPEHIGIVSKIGLGAFTVIEGNINGGKIGTRPMEINGRYIRGFICPDYAAIAKKLTEREAAAAPAPAPESAPVEDPLAEDFKKGWAAYRKSLQDNDSSTYSAEARAWAISNGLIVGSGKTPSGEPNYMWEDVPSREQLITILYRFAVLIGKA